jgi:uncharacterized protein with von Willebrand factor type A (vWA) domain
MYFKKKIKSVGGWVASRWQGYLFDSRSVTGSLRSSLDVMGESLTDNDDAAPTANEDYDGWCETLKQNNVVANEFGKEVFGRLYGSPDEAEGTVGWATEAHRLIDNMGEFEQLRRSVAGDPDFSALAARDLIDAIQEQVPNLMQSAQDREDEQNDEGDEGDVPGEGSEGNEGNQPSKAPSNNGLPTAEDMARSALRKAFRKISKDVEETKQTMNGIAPGMGSPPPSHEQADESRFKLAERVGDSERFRSIMQKAGRLRRVASQEKSVRDKKMRSEVVDVERGADLSRVLPSQIGGLRHPLMSKVVKKGIIERTLMQYRLEGSEKKGRGPVVVLIDRSGSMDGECERWASAIGIAMVGVARKSKRSLTVLGFNGSITTAAHISKRGECQIASFDDNYAGRKGRAKIDFQKVNGGPAKMAEYIASENSGGGTNFEPPLMAALNHLPDSISDEKADLIFVTDGEAEMTEAMRESITEAKSNGLRIFGITISGGYITGVMKEMCNSITDIDPYAEDPTDQIGSVLGQ